MQIKKDIQYIKDRLTINRRSIFRRAHWLAKQSVFGSYSQRFKTALAKCYQERKQWIKTSTEELQRLTERLADAYAVKMPSVCYQGDASKYYNVKSGTYTGD